ncbi:recombinase family protein [Mesorhizobium sp. M0802]
MRALCTGIQRGPDARQHDRQSGHSVAGTHCRRCFVLEPGHSYLDDGYSGSILLRPALERLRDAVASGHVERLYVLAPDRLARRYAHQALLIDEFRRAGVEIVFLNRPIGGTAEDDLLLQDPRAEPSRSSSCGPFRLRQRSDGCALWLPLCGPEPRWRRGTLRGWWRRRAHIVRLIFAWVGLDRMSLREVCQRLKQMGCQTRAGAPSHSPAVCASQPARALRQGRRLGCRRGDR